MQEFTSISKRRFTQSFFFFLALLGLQTLFVLQSRPSFAQPPTNTGASGEKGENKASKPEDEDFGGTPFTEYGEFNESTDEDADSKFFQFGRFFGVSLGMGVQFIDGNRGSIWQGGFPVVDFKVHYWFDFNVALDLGFRTASHFFEDISTLNRGHVDVNMLAVGVNIKYYFPTKNLSAPISFANPFLVLGTSIFSKTENSNTQGTQDPDSSLGLNIGAGFEFAITPRKVFFQIEGKLSLITFKDTYTTFFQSRGIQNLTGNFYTFTGSLLFTW